jgi:site-specific DNA recombinase
MTTSRRPRAVLYLRLSVSAEESTAIERQERDLRALAQREGWDVVATVTDDGLSGGQRRKEADRALSMLGSVDTSGKKARLVGKEPTADVLMVWKFDRWSRQGPRAVADLQDVLDARADAGDPALCVTDEGLRSDSQDWHLRVALAAGMGRIERETVSRRVRSSIDYRRTVTDRFTGGAAVPFGYRSERAPAGDGRVLVPEPSEAVVVREVADRLLDGVEPLSKVAADLTERGVATSKSPFRRAARNGEPVEGLDRGRWTASTIRSLWTADSLVGRVVHRGALVRDDHGLPRTVWEPILDLSTLESLRQRLGTAPRHAATRPEPRSRGVRQARLLSGLAYCRECGSKLYATTSGGRGIYSCGSSWNGGECPGVKINADGLDAEVVATVLAVAGSAPERVVEERVNNVETTTALAEVEAALREASAMMLDDDADMVALGARMAALKEQRSNLREIPSTVETVVTETGRTLAEAFAANDDVDWRRSVLHWGLDHVTVAPATARGLSPIDPRRVEYVWNS